MRFAPYLLIIPVIGVLGPPPKPVYGQATATPSAPMDPAPARGTPGSTSPDDSRAGAAAPAVPGKAPGTAGNVPGEKKSASPRGMAADDCGNTGAAAGTRPGCTRAETPRARSGSAGSSS